MSVTTLIRGRAQTTKSEPLSPARTKLAAEIGKLNESAATQAGLEQAVGRGGYGGSAQRAIDAARGGVAAAEAALETAKQETVDRHVKAAEGHDVATGLSIKDARVALEVAQDELAAAVEARELLLARMNPAKNAVATAEVGVDTATQGVVREYVSQHLEEVAAELDGLYRQVAERGGALQFLLNLDPNQDVGVQECPLRDNTALLRIQNRFSVPPSAWDIVRDRAPASVTAWRDAIAALRSDASAPLPALRRAVHA